MIRDEITFQRRNRLKKHFVNTSNVLLYGYRTVSDAAKITYQVIDGFDWEDRATGDSKGYVFPAVETLANIRSTSERTIHRHITELEATGLLTRMRRRYKSSILIIEDVSEEEVLKYLSTYSGAPRNTSNHVGSAQDLKKGRNDKSGDSRNQSETTKMSVVYMKKKEIKKDEINVNEIQLKARPALADPESLEEIIERMQKFRAVRKKPLPDIAKREYLAGEIAKQLKDTRSLGCYRVIAARIPERVIFEALGLVKEVSREGRIRQTKGALFVDVIKRFAEGRGIELNFNPVGVAGKDPQGSLDYGGFR
jgi:hypothetical protein